MLKINDERKEKVTFGSLEVGDIFIDPTNDENDTCIKVNDSREEDNAFSFDNECLFTRYNGEVVIPVREAILTIK